MRVLRTVMRHHSRHLPVLTAIVLLSALAAACAGNGSNPATPAPATIPAPRATPTLPRVDGTVDPLGFGGTDPVTVKPNPDPPTGQAVLRDVRVGAHPEEGGWDRIVFEFRDVLPAANIRYERQAIQCGSGMNVPLPGMAILVVKFEPAVAHDDAGRLTIRTLDLSGPGGIILQSRQTCDFEAHVDWAIGVRSEQRFKVTRLSNPTRLVIDIKQ